MLGEKGKIIENMSLSNPWLIGISSLMAAGIIGFIYRKMKSRREIKKVEILDLIGSTPLVYLPRLSKAIGS